MTDEYLGELADMAATLVNVAVQELQIEAAVTAAALSYGCTRGRMKYALSFATSRGMVTIDYDTGTVVAIQPSESDSRS